ncbi:sesquipedalian [Anaeramoeba ignava]|uniref:Sesquipedalian n=1 Tax=Anaeramoeba ignava TaxID=1746090 RepID=A0A9Q0L5Y2_ANAIG|nr:sesquipedalian [Anaeramoeba ignava]
MSTVIQTAQVLAQIKKITTNSWKPFIITLTINSLEYQLHQKSRSSRKKVIDLSKSSLVRMFHGSDPLLKITENSTILFLKFSNEEELSKWKTAIEAVITKIKQEEYFNQSEESNKANQNKMIFKSGLLQKQGKKTLFRQKWRKRYCELLKNSQNNQYELVYYADDSATNPKGKISLSKVKNTKEHGFKNEPFGFQVETEGRTYCFAANSKHEMQSWVSLLSNWTSNFDEKKFIEQHQQNRSTRSYGNRSSDDENEIGNFLKDYKIRHEKYKDKDKEKDKEKEKEKEKEKKYNENEDSIQLQEKTQKIQEKNNKHDNQENSEIDQNEIKEIDQNEQEEIEIPFEGNEDELEEKINEINKRFQENQEKERKKELESNSPLYEPQYRELFREIQLEDMGDLLDFTEKEEIFFSQLREFLTQGREVQSIGKKSKIKKSLLFVTSDGSGIGLTSFDRQEFLKVFPIDSILKIEEGIEEKFLQKVQNLPKNIHNEIDNSSFFSVFFEEQCIRLIAKSSREKLFWIQTLEKLQKLSKLKISAFYF